MLTSEGLALAGLITTLIGTLTAGLGAPALYHHFTRQRELETHNREKKEQTYEEFATLFLVPAGHREHPENYIFLLARALTRINIYAPDKVIAPGQQLVDLEVQLATADDEEKQRLYPRREIARGNLINAMRDDLGT